MTITPELVENIFVALLSCLGTLALSHIGVIKNVAYFKGVLSGMNDHLIHLGKAVAILMEEREMGLAKIFQLEKDISDIRNSIVLNNFQGEKNGCN